MQDSQIDPDSTEEQQIQNVISEAKKYYANNDREKAINLFEVAIDMMEQSDKIDPTLLLETLKVTVDAVQFEKQYQERYLELLLKFYDYAVQFSHRTYAIQSALFIKNVYIRLQKESEVIKWSEIEKMQKELLHSELMLKEQEDKQNKIKGTRAQLLEALVGYDFINAPELESKFTSMDADALKLAEVRLEQEGDMGAWAQVKLQQVHIAHQKQDKENYLNLMVPLIIKLSSEGQCMIENMNLRKNCQTRSLELLEYCYTYIQQQKIDSQHIYSIAKFLQTLNEQLGKKDEAIKYGQIFENLMSDLQKKQLRAVAEHQSKAAKTMDSVEQMQSAIPRMEESQKQLQERVESLEKEVAQLKQLLGLVCSQLKIENPLSEVSQK